MVIGAPYLEAIQALDGTTPGEKQKAIHDIAKQVAQNESSDWDPANAGLQITDVPEPLRPLIRVEVAKILHRYEGIIEALKSEDVIVVSRALQAKWFFDGSDITFVNAKYFRENVFPEISLHARLKVVKKLAAYMKNTSVAAEFFITLTEQYGIDQALPLLSACDEEFAFNVIVDNKIMLSPRMTNELYRKCPDLIVKLFLTLTKGENRQRKTYVIDIYNYGKFLPVIANSRLNAFMQMHGMHESLHINFGKRAVKMFLKTRLDLLLEKPNEYLKLLSLKTVTRKLSKDNFAKMLRNLFPMEMRQFRYDAMNGYLKYYKPEEERMTLIFNTFREKYGRDFLDCVNNVDTDIMQKLPAADRINLARLKFQNDKDWHLYDYNRSWRCYLPTSESIPVITKEIAKCSDIEKRSQLLQQLIFTSKINDDKDALLKVLNYLYDRHRNDQNHIYKCLSIVCESFDLVTLSSAHWEILNKYIKFAEMQDHVGREWNALSRVLEAGIHYCIVNQLPMDDYLPLYVDFRIKIFGTEWNIFSRFPDLEKQFLDLLMAYIPEQYPFNHEIWKDNEIEIIDRTSSSVWRFNNNNKLWTLNNKKLSINDYSWLSEKIETNFFDNPVENHLWRSNVLINIKKHERELYYKWILKINRFWDYGPKITNDVLRTVPQRILANWNECLDKFRDPKFYDQRPSFFITKSRWYQQLPVNFYNESLKNHTDIEIRSRSMITLAYLLDGESYSKLLEPFIPTEAVMDISHPDAKDIYKMLLAIIPNLRRTNPPVTLDLIARFCLGDYLQLALRSLTSVCRRVPLTKVIPFAETLTQRPVSVMKHGIRLTYLAAPLEEIYTFLTRIWHQQRHTSIRMVVFTKIYELFCKKQDTRTWLMLRVCLDTLTPDDDEEIFKSLTSLSKVPNKYLEAYIKSVLNALKTVAQRADDPQPYINNAHRLIQNVDTSVIRSIFIPENIPRND